MKCSYCSTVNQYHRKDCLEGNKKLPSETELSVQEMKDIDDILATHGEEIIIASDDPLLKIPRFKQMWEDSFH